MTTIFIGPYAQGERPEPLIYTFLDENGAPIDLSADYEAEFILTARDVAASEREALVLEQTTNQGQVQFVWDPTDMDTVNEFHGIFWVDNGINRFASSPIRWWTYPADQPSFTFADSYGGGY